ncbi:FMN phosphatase YigB, HAD superfamily [Olsenella sp. KH3B4]|uniref:HAD family hydrolase n=1 Tax=Olsenella sp. KH3B4 TaxID=1855394 RepID=UPI0008CF846B|nr:HAD family hydrolase [Olsenella sp. KH3B4]SES98621.1 FMN phosphatase YigB, HAD superfamily [Olsenella sp. KH3B4]
MIKAVLFDLDDTLLDINFTAFMTRYVAGLSGLIGDISRTPAPLMGAPFMRSYLALEDQARSDDLTNRQLFVREFHALTGIPLDDPVIADAIDFYEREVVPSMRGGIVAARPQRGGRAAVDMVHELGLTCALATNPAFSEACVEARMDWADVSPTDFSLVSNWDNSRRLKPNARFYQEFVNALGLTCDECLMVGNDSRRDFPHPDCGLRTIYVGHAWPRRAVWHGPMSRLARELPNIIRRFDGEESNKRDIGSL